MGPKIDQSICDFIADHHVMTIATVDEAGNPYCANLFYAFLPEEGVFVFTSSTETCHGQQMTAHPEAAASIVLETHQIGLIRGLQLRGRVFNDHPEMMKRAKRAYLKAYPYAALTPLHLWCFEVTFAKYTDNRLGFGKKLLWRREQGETQESSLPTD